MIRSRSRLVGEQVALLVPEEGWPNPLGERTSRHFDEVIVDDVLIVPGDSSDLNGSIRPEGDRTVYTLHFPKTFPKSVTEVPADRLKSLKGMQVKVRDETFRVIGDPKPYMDVNTPTRWNLPVRVEAVNG